MWRFVSLAIKFCVMVASILLGQWLWALLVGYTHEALEVLCR